MTCNGAQIEKKKQGKKDTVRLIFTKNVATMVTTLPQAPPYFRGKLALSCFTRTSLLLLDQIHLEVTVTCFNGLNSRSDLLHDGLNIAANV